LINPGCASACEIFAAAMAHDPSHLIVGRSPSAGVEAGVEPWVLPDGISFQAPVIAFHNPDGSIFLEGVGVIPNVRVPNTPENLLVTPRVDAALDVAVQALQP
ncbi:MAG TPA: S41 family peptidase, partial [Thermomicrobiales bacterium]|nr:S41 family peptidase [Thermomicrobiales bacterium]